MDAFCLKWLPETSADFLQGLCDEYQVVVPPDKAGNRSALLKLVLRHLNSEAVEQTPDQGAAVFLKLYGEIGPELHANGTQIKMEPIPNLNDTRDNPVIDETLSYRKLRQFKINGTISTPGEKNCMTYLSLCFQMNDGEEARYEHREIYAAVIRAIEPGNPLRDVLELGAASYDKAALLKTLQSHFQERDSGSILNDLRCCIQNPKETAHKFVCRAIALKQKVITLSRTEGNPYSLPQVNSTFFKALLTGLRQNNIRNELRPILQEATMSDQDLLVEVSSASATEKERLSKLHKDVDVQQLTLDDDSETSDDESSTSGSGKKKKNKKKTSTLQEDTLKCLQEVTKIAAKVNELSSNNAALAVQMNTIQNSLAAASLTPEVLALSQAMNPHTPAFQQRQLSWQNTPRSPPPGAPAAGAKPKVLKEIWRCPNCQKTNSNYCDHCFICSASDHKAGQCTEKKKNE